MSVVVVTPPDPDFSLDTVKEHLRVDHEDDDNLIQAYIDAACTHIDGPHGILGRAVFPQTLELRRNVFCGPIRLPYGPATSVVSVKYVSESGVEETMPADDYALTYGGELALVSGASWPTLRGDAEGVRIQYVVGFDPTPTAIIQAILLLVGHWYSNRETVTVGQTGIELPMATQALLASYRIWQV